MTYQSEFADLFNARYGSTSKLRDVGAGRGGLRILCLFSPGRLRDDKKTLRRLGDIVAVSALATQIFNTLDHLRWRQLSQPLGLRAAILKADRPPYLITSGAMRVSACSLSGQKKK